LSETRIRNLAGIITRDFRGIKNVNFATLLLSSEAEAAREQARALTFRSAYQTIFNVRSQVLREWIKSASSECKNVTRDESIFAFTNYY
jgi:hypothetical protein